MKKIYLLILIIASVVYSADVKPFIFENIEKDSVSQQNEWDYLMKFKMFGQEGIIFNGQNIKIPDQSGWFGTANGDFDMSQGNLNHLVGGPILIGGNMKMSGGQDTLSSGPVRILGNIVVNEDGFKGRPNVLLGYQCVKGTADEKYIKFIENEYRFIDEQYSDCPADVPEVNENLAIPVYDKEGIEYNTPLVVDNNIKYIDIPAGEGTYDYFIEKITLNNNSRLVIRMPNGGRLTRIFIRDGFSISAHPKIRIQYMNDEAEFKDGQWIGEGVAIDNRDYSGNLLFYTDKNIAWPAIVATDSIQGTFISSGTISIQQHMTLAGQLLANKISINANFDGSGFLYVPFDPPELNIDPTALASGKFIENNLDVNIPIKLDTLAKTNVYFNYCFVVSDMDEGYASISDFNNNIPVCGKDSGKVTILENTKYPTENIILNVKADGIVENEEVLKLKVFNLQGAVMPGNVRSGYFSLHIVDGEVFRIDTTKHLSVDENVSNISIGSIVVDGSSPSTKYYLSDTSKFKIDSITGKVTIKTAYDFENQTVDSVKVIVKDDDKIDSGFIKIDINDVNENPVLSEQSFDIFENTAAPAIIGTIVSSDLDSNTIFKQNEFEIVSSTNSHIHINPNGQIFCDTVLDYESLKEKTVIVNVKLKDKNDAKLFTTAVITINVKDVNEKPITQNTTLSVKENFKGLVGKVQAIDPENDKLTFNIEEKVPFTIDENGNIYCDSLNYEKTNKYNFTVIISDGENFVESKVTLNVLDVNEKPSLKETELKINENKTGEAGTITILDEDKDTKYLNNILSIIDGDTSKFNIEGNKVIVKTPLDYEKDSIFTIKIKVKDSIDSLLSDTLTYVLKVLNVPEKPEVKDIVVSVDENKTGVIDTIKATDPDGDKLKYEVIDNKNIKVDSNGVITIVNPFDYESDSTIIAHIVVTDPTGLKDTANVSIKVKDVNEPHSVSDETIEIPEDINVPTAIDTIKVKDPDYHNNIKYELIDTTGTFKIDSNGIISVVKPVDYEKIKEYVVNVIAKDKDFVDTAKIKINIKNVEEKSNLDIVHVDTRDSVYSHESLDNPIYTNDNKVNITYKVNDKVAPIDTTITNLKEGPNKIKLCYKDPSKDSEGCDEVTIYYSEATPIITVATISTDNQSINGTTIVDVPDSNQYVNKEQNNIKVTIKDPIDSKNDTSFIISVNLHTIDVPAKEIKNFNIEPSAVQQLAQKHEIIADNRIKVSYTQIIDNKPVTISYITDNTGKRIDETFTVNYTSKINGQDVNISYVTDNMIEVKSNYTISYTQVNGNDTLLVSYDVNSNGVIQKNKDNNVGYTISYSYTNKYGNTGTSEVFVILDNVIPKVEIVYPFTGDVFYTNSIKVEWKVDGISQDTLNLERLEHGNNMISRCYMDKANNISCDTLYVFMKNAKDIEISLLTPITKVDKNKVDDYYANGGNYSPKNPFNVIIKNPNVDTIPNVIGVGLKVSIVLPSISPVGGLATVNDMIQTIDGKTGIIMNKNGELVSGTSTGLDGSYTIPVETYIEDHCTEQFKDEYRLNGIEHTTIWNVKYKMHIWIFNTIGNYVNDFEFEYYLDDTRLANDAGIMELFIDYMADKDGLVKAYNGKAIATGSYLTKIEAKSFAETRCDLPNQPIGTKLKKKENDLTRFGYKRPLTKK